MIIETEQLIEIHKKTKELLPNFHDIMFVHIFRNKNVRADGLSNNAIIEYLKTIK